MQHITTRIYKKSNFEYQIKNGAKIIARITKVTGGWHCECKIFDTIEGAARYSINSKNAFIKSCGGTKLYEMPNF